MSGSGTVRAMSETWSSAFVMWSVFRSTSHLAMALRYACFSCISSSTTQFLLVLLFIFSDTAFPSSAEWPEFHASLNWIFLDPVHFCILYYLYALSPGLPRFELNTWVQLTSFNQSISAICSSLLLSK